jgi:hypothetical protein
MVSKSLAEAKYRSMAYVTCEIMWLNNILTEFGFYMQDATQLYYDN